MSGVPTATHILETNFVRLLCCTEDLVASGQTNGWRFYSYLSTLHSFLNELNSSECSPSKDYIHHYESRLKQLELAKELVASKSPDQRARLLFAQPIPLVPRPIKDASFILTSTQSDPKPNNDSKTNWEEGEADTVIVRGVLDRGPQVFIKERRRLELKNRIDLLEPSSGIESPLVSDEILASERDTAEHKRPVQSHLLHQEELRREELASEMLGMARELRDRSEIMSTRLQSDRMVVETSISQADRNKAELYKAMGQLSEELGSRCAYVVWIALLIVVIVFAQMVAFMKLFRKRTIAPGPLAQ